MSSTRTMRPDDDEVPREQRRDGDVDSALFAGLGGEVELIKVMYARLVAKAFDGRDEFVREDRAELLAESF